MRILNNLNTTESFAYKYLLNNNVEITKIHHSGLPDFIDKDNNGYEIKRVLKNTITFTKEQIKNLKDDDFIMVFYPFERKPYKIIKFKDIKGKISNLRISIKKIKELQDIKKNSNNTKCVGCGNDLGIEKFFCFNCKNINLSKYLAQKYGV